MRKSNFGTDIDVLGEKKRHGMQQALACQQDVSLFFVANGEVRLHSLRTSFVIRLLWCKYKGEKEEGREAVCTYLCKDNFAKFRSATREETPLNDLALSSVCPVKREMF